MRLRRTIGLNEEQLDELEELVADELREPWDKGIGRPRELSLRKGTIVTVAHLRRSIVQKVLADIFDVSQRMIPEINYSTDASDKPRHETGDSHH